MDSEKCIENVRASDLAGSLVETKTDVQQYEITDSQVSNTASIQHEFLSGSDSALTS